VTVISIDAPALRNAGSVAAAIALAVMPVPGALAAPATGVPVPRAEVQVELCTPFAEVERSLKLRPDGDPIEVWLFDDAALTLFDRGLRVRLRAKGKHAEFTVKIANQDCARIDSKMVPPKEGKCEFDVHGASMSGTVSLSRHLSRKQWTDLVAGRVPAAELLSAVQVAYLRDVARIWPLPTDLRPLGPKQSRAYVMPDNSYEVDVSKLPTGEQYVEMSHRVPVADAQTARAALDAMLARSGVTTCADQAGQAANKLKLMLR
jgi:hypothetical protein